MIPNWIDRIASNNLAFLFCTICLNANDLNFQERTCSVLLHAPNILPGNYLNQSINQKRSAKTYSYVNDKLTVICRINAAKLLESLARGLNWPNKGFVSSHNTRGLSI